MRQQLIMTAPTHRCPACVTSIYGRVVSGEHCCNETCTALHLRLLPLTAAAAAVAAAATCLSALIYCDTLYDMKLSANAE